jgi:predicted Zn-dependent protease
MLNPFSYLSRRYRRRLLYPLLSIVLALSLIVGTPQVSQALPWLNLIFQGIQVIQLSNISDRQEVQIAGQINQQLVSDQVQLYRNPQITRYVDEIGQRLAKGVNALIFPILFRWLRIKILMPSLQWGALFTSTRV